MTFNNDKVSTEIKWKSFTIFLRYFTEFAAISTNKKETSQSSQKPKIKIQSFNVINKEKEKKIQPKVV